MCDGRTGTSEMKKRRACRSRVVRVNARAARPLSASVPQVLRSDATRLRLRFRTPIVKLPRTLLALAWFAVTATLHAEWQVASTAGDVRVRVPLDENGMPRDRAMHRGRPDASAGLEVAVSLTFLRAGAGYSARVHEYDPTNAKATRVRTENVDSRSVLRAKLPAAGSQAVWRQALP